jgi:predicted nucleic acid-binding protein
MSRAESPVMLDTCIWIDALRGRSQATVDAARRLLDEGLVVRCDVVTAELRYGLRLHERARVLPLLEAVPNVEVTSEDWNAAADLGAELRASGTTLPLTDLLVARVCLRRDARLWTTDGHFDAIDGLVRYVRS